MPTASSPDRLALAFDRTAAHRAALSADDLTVVNLDVPTAVTTVLGSLSELRALRAEIAELPKFDIKQLDDLEDYALATAQAHAAYLAASTPTTELASLNDQAVHLRELLMSDATALARRSLIDGKRLAEFKGLPGYRNVAIELLGLTTVLRESWPQIESKTALQLRELEEARRLADQMLTAVGVREQAPVLTAAASDTRTRAFTLFVQAYDEVRSAVHFLRRKQGDADSIAPSLYAGRGKSRKTPTPDAEPAPVVPQSAPVTPPANGTPGAPGTPDASPFASS